MGSQSLYSKCFCCIMTSIEKIYIRVSSDRCVGMMRAFPGDERVHAFRCGAGHLAAGPAGDDADAAGLRGTAGAEVRPAPEHFL